MRHISDDVRGGALQVSVLMSI